MRIYKERLGYEGEADLIYLCLVRSKMTRVSLFAFLSGFILFPAAHLYSRLRSPFIRIREIPPAQ